MDPIEANLEGIYPEKEYPGLAKAGRAIYEILQNPDPEEWIHMWKIAPKIGIPLQEIEKLLLAHTNHPVLRDVYETKNIGGYHHFRGSTDPENKTNILMFLRYAELGR